MVIRRRPPPARALLPWALFPCALLLGCEPGDPCAGRIDLLDTPEGLVLVEEEHRAGWGNDQCLQCHPSDATHTADCSDELELDMQAVREAAADGEYESCAACHGDNGVEP